MYALSTRWNAFRHAEGEPMLAEILELGFSRVELGYDLTANLVPGVKKLVTEKTVSVSSVHNFCPVPTGAPFGHPELFELVSRDRLVRERAVEHTRRSIAFAATVGASAVVLHLGNVPLRPGTRRLATLCAAGKRQTPRYEKLKIKLLARRERRVAPYLEQARRSLEELGPAAEDAGVKLAVENLPAWESVPTELELEKMFKDPPCACLSYWHDLGHGQVRENLGLIDHAHWAGRLAPHLVGCHIHDVLPPISDHLMPPAGGVAWHRFRCLAAAGREKVFEPAPGIPGQDIRRAHEVLAAAWAAGGPPADEAS